MFIQPMFVEVPASLQPLQMHHTFSTQPPPNVMRTLHALYVSETHMFKEGRNLPKPLGWPQHVRSSIRTLPTNQSLVRRVSQRRRHDDALTSLPNINYATPAPALDVTHLTTSAGLVSIEPLLPKSLIDRLMRPPQCYNGPSTTLRDSPLMGIKPSLSSLTACIITSTDRSLLSLSNFFNIHLLHILPCARLYSPHSPPSSSPRTQRLLEATLVLCMPSSRHSRRIKSYRMSCPAPSSRPSSE